MRLGVGILPTSPSPLGPRAYPGDHFTWIAQSYGQEKIRAPGTADPGKEMRPQGCETLGPSWEVGYLTPITPTTVLDITALCGFSAPGS